MERALMYWRQIGQPVKDVLWVLRINGILARHRTSPYLFSVHVEFHDEWVDDLDLLQYRKGKVRQLPIVYFHFHNNPTVLIDVDYMYLRILLGFNAKAEQTYFAIRGGKAKRVDAASVVEAASVCGGKSHFAAKLRICPPRHAAIRDMMPSRCAS
ncbi:hypothetical protein DPMN_002461 [Dreissena polymorpha]|uniref:Uncharacterized protein n=1 Tax=Dreissena polymorpha TaxID=45954 RepID=A0A9D4RRS3_DREPO|nr:hypothetical protein DPMN_002461 [Dreissena polymorpha]